MNTDLRELTARWAQPGALAAIWLRPARGQPAQACDSVLALAGSGLQGDRTAARTASAAASAAVNATASAAGGGRRQVTLLQGEHLPLIAAWPGLERVEASALRRNLVVTGLNLLSARSPFADRPVLLHIGDEVVLELTGPCDPCSKMEQALGPAGYNAMRGHGGLTARVLHGGRLRVGDAVRAAASTTAVADARDPLRRAAAKPLDLFTQDLP